MRAVGDEIAFTVGDTKAFSARLERPEDGPPAVRALVERIGREPALGRLAAGRLVASYFGWSLADTAAAVHRCEIAVGRPLPALGPVAARALAVSAMEWKLSWPMPVWA
jgi:hypothetical protein